MDGRRRALLSVPFGYASLHYEQGTPIPLANDLQLFNFRWQSLFKFGWQWTLDLSSNEYLYILDFSNNPNLHEITQTGKLIAGLRWSIINVGATSTGDKGTIFSFEGEPSIKQCADGWRIPTYDEYFLLWNKYRTGEKIGGDVYKEGIYGRWYSENSESVFFPFTNTNSSDKLAYTAYYLCFANNGYYIAYFGWNHSTPCNQWPLSKCAIRCVKDK